MIQFNHQKVLLFSKTQFLDVQMALFTPLQMEDIPQKIWPPGKNWFSPSAVLAQLPALCQDPAQLNDAQTGHGKRVPSIGTAVGFLWA